MLTCALLAISQRLGFARVDTLVVHGLDYAVAEARTAAIAAGLDRDAAEESVLQQLEGWCNSCCALRVCILTQYMHAPKPPRSPHRSSLAPSFCRHCASIAVTLLARALYPAADGLVLTSQYTHPPTPRVAGPSGGMATLLRLKEEGRIGAVGFAINEECPVHPRDDEAARVAWNLGLVKRMLALAGEGGGFDFIIVSGMYTLLNFSAGERGGILDVAAAAKVAVQLAAPFNSGILAQDGGTFDGAWFSYAAASAPLVKRARGLLDVCRKHGVSLRQAALTFPLSHPSITTVIVGAKSAAEAADCVALAAAAARDIPAAFWQELRQDGLVPPDAPLPAGL